MLLIHFLAVPAMILITAACISLLESMKFGGLK